MAKPGQNAAWATDSHSADLMRHAQLLRKTIPKPTNERRMSKVSGGKTAGWQNESNESYASPVQLDILERA